MPRYEPCSLKAKSTKDGSEIGSEFSSEVDRDDVTV